MFLSDQRTTTRSPAAKGHTFGDERQRFHDKIEHLVSENAHLMPAVQSIARVEQLREEQRARAEPETLEGGWFRNEGLLTSERLAGGTGDANACFTIRR